MRGTLWIAGAAAALFLAGCATDGVGPAEPVMLVEPMPPAPSGAASPRMRAAAAMPAPGVLSAGDIDDTLNLAAFNRARDRGRAATGLPEADFRRPVVLRLVGPDGSPAAGARVTLRVPGRDAPFFDGYSGIDGNITVFPAILGAGRPSTVDLRVVPADQGAVFTRRLATGVARQTITLPFATEWEPDFLDLVFVIDTTGSMADELSWLTDDLSAILRNATRQTPGIDVRYGLIVYRDRGDDYVVRDYGFSDSMRQMRRWLRAESAEGGGDYPEAADAALAAAAALPWRRGRGERLLFHIADAPPHAEGARAYLDAAGDATRQNVQIFGLGASGVAAESEYLMRQAAAQSQGRYLFLTDDSGVGYAHAEPTISCYRVTSLTSLMARVIGSELIGRRIEAPPSQTIREVGSYRAGVCID
jgi:hypothetical protein